MSISDNFFATNKFDIKITTDPKIWNILENRYSVSPFEIAQIDLNRSGIWLPNKEVRENFRVRFKANLFDNAQSWFALPVGYKI